MNKYDLKYLNKFLKEFSRGLNIIGMTWNILMSCWRKFRQWQIKLTWHIWMIHWKDRVRDFFWIEVWYRRWCQTMKYDGFPWAKFDGTKEVKMWRHKGRQLWWKFWKVFSWIDRRCNTWTHLNSMLCLTDYSKLG